MVMGNLFGKFTLYDIISMAIPGFLVMLGVCLVIPSTVHQFVVSVDNSWFIFVIGISVSYSVGWIISEISKCIIKVNLKCKKGLCVNWRIVILVDFSMFYGLSQIPFDLYSNVIVWILFIIIISHCILFLYKKESQESNDNIGEEYRILMKECYKCLKEKYEDFNEKLENEEQIIKKVTKMSNSANFLIQTDDKYSRIHNYSSSKSFSKNMGTVCLFWAGILLYQLIYNSKDICFAVVYTLGILFLLFGFFAMQKRYKRFEKKMGVLIVTYYLDFLENKKNKDSNYNTNQFDLNLNINNHTGRN